MTSMSKITVTSYTTYLVNEFEKQMFVTYELNNNNLTVSQDYCRLVQQLKLITCVDYASCYLWMYLLITTYSLQYSNNVQLVLDVV